MECIESERSWNSPQREQEYDGYLRDGLYLAVAVPKSPDRNEKKARLRLTQIKEMLSDGGIGGLHAPTLFVYDYGGNVEKVEPTLE